MNEELQQLLDKQAINEVLQRCSRTLDWLDEEGQASCYWPDGDIDFGFFQGRADAYVPMVMKHQRGAAKRWHISTNVMIKLDGDRARAESYGITVGAGSADGPRRMYGGRYLDELEKRSQEWRISRRVYILDWSKTFADDSAEARLEGAALYAPDITEPNHELYRKM
ncbi:MAG: nuclear transport factor 2 family protein [Proteobacteria bacterium]|nr:nuclear transport factor 2 family protein [Pseudomonadota bacterium]